MFIFNDFSLTALKLSTLSTFRTKPLCAIQIIGISFENLTVPFKIGAFEQDFSPSAHPQKILSLERNPTLRSASPTLVGFFTLFSEKSLFEAVPPCCRVLQRLRSNNMSNFYDKLPYSIIVE